MKKILLFLITTSSLFVIEVAAQSRIDTFSIFDSSGYPKLDNPLGMNPVQRYEYEAYMRDNPSVKGEVKENLSRQNKANILYYNTGRKLAQEAAIARDSAIEFRAKASGLSWYRFHDRSVLKGAADISEKKAELLERQIKILRMQGEALEKTGKPLIPNF